MRFLRLCAGVALVAPAAAFAMGAGAAISSASAAGNMQVTMPRSPVPKFKQADTNHDGKIEWKEAKADGVPKKLFERDDFNHNGTLSKTEWMFVRLDMTNYKMPTHAAATGTGG